MLPLKTFSSRSLKIPNQKFSGASTTPKNTPSQHLQMKMNQQIPRRVWWKATSSNYQTFHPAWPWKTIYSGTSEQHGSKSPVVEAKASCSLGTVKAWVTRARRKMRCSTGFKESQSVSSVGWDGAVGPSFVFEQLLSLVLQHPAS